jgi:hypothetical protein
MLQNHRFINFLKQNFMKNLILTAKCLLIALIFTNLPTKTVMAQFIPPNTPDESATQTSGGLITRNTGNDIAELGLGSGEEIRVSVWDDVSNQAAFGWEVATTAATGFQILDGTNYGTISDPDIILSKEGYFVFIVYELDFDVYYECWEFDGTSSWSLIINPTQLNTAQPARNPNIDGINTNNFEMVAVWEQENGEIWTIPGDVNGFGSYAPVYLESSDYFPCYWPDVAVYYNPASGNITANYTYVQDLSSLTFWALWHQHEDYNDLINGTVVPNFNGLDVCNPGEFGRPRIACNNMWDDDDSNYAVAIRYWDIPNNRTYIHTYTRCSGTKYGPNVINDNSPDLTDPTTCFANNEPAIAYAYDLLLVVWTYEDACWGYLYNDKEIIQKRCNPCNGTSATTETLVVNEDFNLDQLAPSVASRHSLYQNALYTWWDEDQSDVKFKSSHFANSPIRIMGRSNTTKVSVFPNPSYDLINISGDIKVESFKIMDLQGKVLTEKTSQQNIDVKDFQSGIYLLQILFENGTADTFKIQILK